MRIFTKFNLSYKYVFSISFFFRHIFLNLNYYKHFYNHQKFPCNNQQKVNEPFLYLQQIFQTILLFEILPNKKLFQYYDYQVLRQRQISKQDDHQISHTQQLDFQQIKMIIMRYSVLNFLTNISFNRYIDIINGKDSFLIIFSLIKITKNNQLKYSLKRLIIKSCLTHKSSVLKGSRQNNFCVIFWVVSQMFTFNCFIAFIGTN